MTTSGKVSQTGRPAKAAGRFSRAVLYAGIAAVGGTFFGYGTASITGALSVLGRNSFAGFGLHDIALMALLFGAVLGALAGGRMADFCGRRDTIMSTASFFALGSFVTGLSDNLGWFIFGRFLEGISVGIVSVAVPVFIAEIAPARQRGRLVALTQLCITIGIFLAYAVDAVCAPDVHGWRVVFMIGSAFAVVLGLGMLLLPNSPRWLILQEDEPMAREAMRLAQSPDHEKIVASVLENLKIDWGQAQTRITHPDVRPVVLVVSILFAFQQLTGINIFLYLAPLWFQSIGFSQGFGSLLASIGLGLTNLIFTVAGIMLVDQIGRRQLLVAGFLGCGITLLAISGLTSVPIESWTAIRFVLLPMYLLYIACFAIGPGLILWVYVGELFPLRIRGKAASLPATVHWVFNLVLLWASLAVIHHTTRPPVIALFALFSFGGAYYSLRFAPETKGMTLEEIERFWIGSGRPWHLPLKR